MKRSLLVVLIFAGLYLYFKSGDKPEQVQTPPSPELEAPAVSAPGPLPQPLPPPRPAIPPPPFKVVTPEPQKPAQKPSYPKQGLVAFKVEDGLAIAFGDMILGKPTETIDKGFFKPAPQQPWKGVEIPYGIANDLPFPERVEEAIAYFNEFTPVRFVPLRGQKDGLIFERAETLCASYVGRVGGLQPIRLSESCGMTEILHEIMHALGFVHEHSRSDRDLFVSIDWDNIDPLYWDQFAEVPDALMSLQKGTEFDFASIMIYPSNAFARNASQPTLMSLHPEAKIEPARTGLSPRDLERLNRVFRR